MKKANAETTKLQAPLRPSRELDEHAARIATYLDTKERADKAEEVGLADARKAVHSLSVAGVLGTAAAELALELGGPALGRHLPTFGGVYAAFFERLYTGDQIVKFDDCRFPTIKVDVPLPSTRVTASHGSRGGVSLFGAPRDEVEEARIRMLDAELAVRAGTSTK